MDVTHDESLQLLSVCLLGGLVGSRYEIAGDEAAVVAMGDAPGERPLEVGEGFEAEEPAGTDQREERAEADRALLPAGVQRVVADQVDLAQLALGPVVVELDRGVVQEASERILMLSSA